MKHKSRIITTGLLAAAFMLSAQVSVAQEDAGVRRTPKFKTEFKAAAIKAPAKAVAKSMAALTVPFTETFDIDPGYESWGYYDRLDHPSGAINHFKWEDGSMHVYALTPSGTNDGGYDSWLITPGIRLEKGKIYEWSADCWGDKRYNGGSFERFELAIGDQQVPEALTKQLTDGFVIVEKWTATDCHTETLNFSVDADGIYYIGIHAQNVKDNWEHHGSYMNFYFDNISLTTAAVISAPAMVEDLVVVPDINGARSVEISFTTPAKNIADEAITSLDEVEILRDNESIHTFAAPAVGTKLTFTDTTPADGEHTYTVLSKNAGGTSLPTSAVTFVGFSNPSTPEQAWIVEDADTPGKVHVSWTPVTTDVNGKIFPEGTVKYYIACEDYVMRHNYEGTSIEYMANTDNVQHFVYYGVFAQTDFYGYSNDYARTQTIPVGPHDTAPFIDSFSDGNTDYSWCNDGDMSVYGTGWGIAENIGDPLVDWCFEPYDDDNGCLSAGCNKGGEYTWMCTGKIDLSPLSDPYLSFAMFTWPFYGRPDTFSVYAREVGETDWTLQADYSTEVNAGELDGWKRFFVPIPQYKGKMIQIAFKYTMGNHYYGFLDQIRLINVPDNDLAATGIDVAVTAATGEEHPVVVTVENTGRNMQNAYTVELYVNGKAVQSQPGQELWLGEKATYTFTNTLGVENPRNSVYKAHVSLSGDADATNDFSADAPVTLIHPNYPAVADLHGAKNADGTHTLSWTMPDTSNPIPNSSFDSFEAYKSFIIDEVGPWFVRDNDYRPNYPIENLTFTNNGEQFAYIVMDGHDVYKDALYGHSGRKSLAAMPSMLDLNDDWLISPLLYGGAQTVSFWARSVDPIVAGHESFEFLVSSTDRVSGSFTRIDEVPEVPQEWTKYTYDIPFGTAYFAIRCVSENKFIFMVDDIEYISDETGLPDLTFGGYNVYRDGVKLNEAPIAANSYTAAADGADHIYNVTAVYAAGESRFSNAYNTDPSSVAEIVIDENAPVEYYNLQGMRVDCPATGVYIMRQGSRAAKIYVK